MERTTYNIIVAWREGEAGMQSLTPERFNAAREFFIDQGYRNLQAERYVKCEQNLPSRLRIFAYWEDPDVSPTYEQLRAWGDDGITLTVEEAK